MKDFISLTLQFFGLNLLAIASIFMASVFLGRKQWILHFVGFACFVCFIQLATITLRELQAL